MHPQILRSNPFMQYTKITFQTTDPDLLLALLHDLPFDSFEETPDALLAYLPSADYTPSVKQEIIAIQERISFTFEVAVIPYQNWNAIWESNFTPIRVKDFCGIRADFHPEFDPPVSHTISIQPKMAFGTGHHATTWMMIDAMQTLNFEGKKVLDYGCGTGILAILAAKLGATPIDAVDIEPPAVDNTKEHLILNQTPNIAVYEGTLDQLAKKHYEIILANINRNVILDSLPSLYQQLKPNGHLLISGFIQPDTDLLKTSTLNQGFTIEQIYSKDKWICMVLNKK